MRSTVWFQSTRPRRGATSVTRCTVSIHAPPKGRDSRGMDSSPNVSIHAPPKGRDVVIAIHAPPKGRDQGLVVSNVFQSTRPRRGATFLMQATVVSIYAPICTVSIHAPPKGRDHRLHLFAGKTLFQSTRPRRGATYCIKVSIHAASVLSCVPSFNPRAPEGARPLRTCNKGALTRCRICL